VVVLLVHRETIRANLLDLVLAVAQVAGQGVADLRDLAMESPLRAIFYMRVVLVELSDKLVVMA
jgi:hypothetical protein